jgi:hypothetical protein
MAMASAPIKLQCFARTETNFGSHQPVREATRHPATVDVRHKLWVRWSARFLLPRIAAVWRYACEAWVIPHWHFTAGESSRNVFWGNGYRAITVIVSGQLSSEKSQQLTMSGRFAKHRVP